MNANEKQAEGRRPFFVRLERLLLHPLWRPEPDEIRFLAGLPIAMSCILFLWKKGIDPLGGYSIQATFAVWCLAYVIRFGKRLRERGELKRVIIAPAVFMVLLLGVRLY